MVVINFVQMQNAHGHQVHFFITHFDDTVTKYGCAGINPHDDAFLWQIHWSNVLQNALSKNRAQGDDEFNWMFRIDSVCKEQLDEIKHG
jgi:hypothetical protein